MIAAARDSAIEIGLIGGSGFIGSALVKILLDRGYKVRILDIAQPLPSSAAAEYRYSDVRDLSLLTKTLQGCKLVINLAAKHRDDVRPVSLYHEVNVLGAENVCNAAVALGIDDIIFTSSVAVYGFPRGEPDEESPPNPFNHYGKTKREAEGVYRAWQNGALEKRRLEIVRPTVVFGPGNRGNVYNLLAQLTRPRFVMVGKGTNRKSMAYVCNIAAYLMFLIEADHSPGAYLYNYCDTPAYSMNELLYEVRTALKKPTEPSIRLPYAVGIAIGATFDLAALTLGRTFAVSKVRVQKFCANTVFSSKRVQSSGFTPPYDLRQALHRTIAIEFSPEQTV